MTFALLDNGRVLVAGGVGPNGRAVTAAEIYDPVTNAWTAAAPMYQARAGHTATALFDGRVVLAGGDDAGAPVDTLELFDPYAGVFTPATAHLTTARKSETGTKLPNFASRSRGAKRCYARA